MAGSGVDSKLACLVAAEWPKYSVSVGRRALGLLSEFNFLLGNS